MNDLVKVLIKIYLKTKQHVRLATRIYYKILKRLNEQNERKLYNHVLIPIGTGYCASVASVS